MDILIPLTALMIPISAILVHSPIGRAMARRLEQGTSPNAEAEIASLRLRVSELEAHQLEQGTQVRQLQESTEFYKQLLASHEEHRQLK